MKNNQFYALMPDNTVKLINLDDGIVDDIKSIFVKGAKQLEPVDSKGTKFTGDYVARAGEDVFYVEFTLPDCDIYRNLFMIKKIKSTPGKFPRKAGLPSKEPIQCRK